MALRVGIAAVLVIVAAAVAFWLERRKWIGEVPFAADREGVRQLQRSDFARADTPWLVVLFSSVECAGCAEMADKVAVLESESVAVAVCEYPGGKELHQRYAIEAVPLVVVADAQGVVRKSFLGSASATDLWAAVAEARDAERS